MTVAPPSSRSPAPSHCDVAVPPVTATLTPVPYVTDPSFRYIVSCSHVCNIPYL